MGIPELGGPSIPSFGPSDIPLSLRQLSQQNRSLGMAALLEEIEMGNGILLSARAEEFEGKDLGADSSLPHPSQQDTTQDSSNSNKGSSKEEKQKCRQSSLA